MTSPGGLNAGTLTVRIVSDASGLSRDVRQEVDQAAGAAEQGTAAAAGRIGERARSIGTKASVGLTLPLLAVGKLATDAASTVQEATNKAQVSFGPAAAEVEAWAKTTAESIGISRGAALTAAGDFGAFFRTLGIGQPEAAGMSKNLTELAADMASFNDATPEEALAALQSGFAGSSEPLRRFGVFMSEARINAEAFATGLAEPTKNAEEIGRQLEVVRGLSEAYTEAVEKHGGSSEQAAKALDAQKAAENELGKAMEGNTANLSEQEKAQLRFQIIQKDTALAQGDVQRSMEDSAAVQASFAKAAREDAAAAMGESLLPISIMLSEAVATLANGFTSLPGPVQKVAVGVGLLAAVSGPLLLVFGNLLRVVKLLRLAKLQHAAATLMLNARMAAMVIQQKLAAAATVAGTVAQRAAAVASRLLAVGMRAVGVAVRFAMGPVGLIITALAILAAGIAYAWNNSETFQRVVKAVFAAVRDAISSAIGVVTGVLEKLGGFLKGAFLAYVRTWKRVLSAAFEAVKKVASAVAGVVTGAWEKAGGVLGRVADKISGAFSSAFGAVRRVAETMVGAVRGALNSVIRALRRLRIPSFSVGVGPIKYEFGGLSPFGGIPLLASGGIVPATPGGRLAVVGEGRHDEAVVPLDRARLAELGLGGGGSIHVEVHNPAPEPASESVNRQLRRLAALGVTDLAGRGAVQLAAAGRS